VQKQFVDDYKTMVWQHSGQHFVARMLFHSRFLSGPSPVIEPMAVPKSFPKIRDGVIYMAPALLAAACLGIAVGASMIEALAKYYRVPLDIINSNIVTDKLGRPVVEFVLDKPNDFTEAPTNWQIPDLLDERFCSYYLPGI